MSLCPCGCRRKVPFGKGGYAKSYIYICDEVFRIETCIQKGKTVEDPSMTKFVGWGKMIAGQLIDHVHGTAHPSTHFNGINISLQVSEWKNFASKLTFEYRGNQPTSPQPSYDDVVQLLLRDPIMFEIELEEREPCAFFAIDKAVDLINKLDLAVNPPVPLGTEYLENKALFKSDSYATLSYSLATKDGATDQEFKLWHDQNPMVNCSIMAMHQVIVETITERATADSNEKETAMKSVSRRVPTFGNPYNTNLISPQDQPLPWEVRTRVMVEWQRISQGRLIPAEFNSANQFFRQAYLMSRNP